MLSIILVATAIIGLPLLLALRNRAPRGVESSTAPAQTGKSATPIRAAPTRLLVLRTADECACEMARHNANKTFDRDSAPKLPLAGCGGNCRCRFEAIADRRRKPRRESSDRRGLIRFEKLGDRRSNPDRRKQNNVWDPR